jgi:histidinol-phosphate aminotransferase
VKLRPDWSLDLEAMAKAIDSETRIVTVCNPNNPTGQILDPAELRRFLDQVPEDVLVPIDEAYIHFADDPDYPSAIPLARDYPNVIVSRTFSKAYGLGGARVGYGIANPELLKKLRRFGLGDLNKNTLSIAAALGALDDPDHVRNTVEAVRAGKKYLYAQLEALGYRPIRTQTIFVTVEVGKGVKALIEALRERKVKVREAFDMEGYMRISVGLPRENETVIEELRRIPRPSGD